MVLARGAVGLLVFAVALSGCSTGSTPESPPISTGSSSDSVPLPAPAPEPVLTDVMHLLDPPHVGGQLEGLAEPYRTVLQGDGLLVDHPTWTIPRPADLVLVDATVDLTVEVQGAVANTEATGCFWQVTLLVDMGSGAYHVKPFCAPDAAVPPPGVRTISLSTTGFDISADPGTEILVQVSVNGVIGPGAVHLLSGTTDSDSTVSIKGLQLPIETRTLLA